MRARIFSRLGFSVSGIFSPERTERFFRNARCGVILRPGTHRIERRAAETEPAGVAQSDSRETAHQAKTPGTLHGPLPDFETRSFCPGTSGMIHRVAAIFEKVVMQINFHGASVRARAAEGRRIGEMVKLVNAAQMGSENAADWARISGAVSVAANSAKHRANIEAGAAANAMQHVALLDVREQFGSAIVEQHDVEFLGAVDLIRLARAANQSVIAGDGLASACSGKDGPKQGEILEPRNHFFDSRERDMNTRDAGAEAALPSLVVRAIMPASATRKLAPLIPISAEKKSRRNARRAAATSSTGSSVSTSPNFSLKRSAMSFRVRCMAGVTM